MKEALAKEFEKLLACPLCKGSLAKRKKSFFCPNCERKFPIREGIIDFRA
ncbi:MAG TPA: Trm112 family protein [Candidatus Nanoarchaeia archaeon]|nr:Trm112 family protein [Candidatus Nanoarchaeia archaeon]